MTCPNCEATIDLHDGACPECMHDENADQCDCAHCEHERADHIPETDIGGSD